MEGNVRFLITGGRDHSCLVDVASGSGWCCCRFFFDSGVCWVGGDGVFRKTTVSHGASLVPVPTAVSCKWKRLRVKESFFCSG